MQQLNPWVSIYIPLATTIIVAFATVVLVWLTSRYVRLTGHLVEETKLSRAPSVHIDFEMPNNQLRLVVANYGQSTAKNIKMTVLKDVAWLRTRKDASGLTGIAPIRNGISHLTPGRKLKYYLGYPNWNGIKDEDMAVSIRVVYDDEFSKHHEHIVDYDFDQMREVLFESFKDPGLAVAEAIRDVERDRQSNESTKQWFNAIGSRKKMKCPMCAELIPEEAKKCSHCHEILNKA
jgi:hypothetical protein